MTVLSTATGLPNELAFGFGWLAKGLAKCDLGLAHISADLEFPQKAVYDNVQVQLAHARDKGLPGLFIN